MTRLALVTIAALAVFVLWVESLPMPAIGSGEVGLRLQRTGEIRHLAKTVQGLLPSVPCCPIALAAYSAASSHAPVAPVDQLRILKGVGMSVPTGARGMNLMVGEMGKCLEVSRVYAEFIKANVMKTKPQGDWPISQLPCDAMSQDVGALSVVGYYEAPVPLGSATSPQPTVVSNGDVLPETVLQLGEKWGNVDLHSDLLRRCAKLPDVCASREQPIVGIIAQTGDDHNELWLRPFVVAAMGEIALGTDAQRREPVGIPAASTETLLPPSLPDANETPQEGRGTTDRSSPGRRTMTPGFATYLHPSLAGGLMRDGVTKYDPEAIGPVAAVSWELGTELYICGPTGRCLTGIVSDTGKLGTNHLDVSEGMFSVLAGSLDPGVIEIEISWRDR